MLYWVVQKEAGPTIGLRCPSPEVASGLLALIRRTADAHASHVSGQEVRFNVSKKVSGGVELTIDRILSAVAEWMRIERKDLKKIDPPVCRVLPTAQHVRDWQSLEHVRTSGSASAGPAFVGRHSSMTVR